MLLLLYVLLISFTNYQFEKYIIGNDFLKKHAVLLKFEIK